MNTIGERINFITQSMSKYSGKEVISLKGGQSFATVGRLVLRAGRRQKRHASKGYNQCFF